MSRIDDSVRVTLSCGCRVRVRLKPLRGTSRYVCRSGLGHSYNQPWVSYEDNGRTFQNESLAAQV